MKWTKVTPKNDGWYWWRCDDYTPRIVKIMNGCVWFHQDSDYMSLAMAENFKGVAWSDEILPPAS